MMEEYSLLSTYGFEERLSKIDHLQGMYQWEYHWEYHWPDQSTKSLRLILSKL